MNQLSFRIHELSIPVTWDFPLHQEYNRKPVTHENTFNSRYLGFSIAPISAISRLVLIRFLSIPVTWDFPLHQCENASACYFKTDFQFPLLGIFHCTIFGCCGGNLRILRLSIPVTWDFPLHPVIFWHNSPSFSHSLSIPVTWDFPLHRFFPVTSFLLLIVFFQFPLLGIFHCTT